jgi:hypothetical protein
MTTIKTALVAIALGATALTSTSAFAKFLPATHLAPSQSNSGAVAGRITTPGVPGTLPNTAPSYPSGSSPNVPTGRPPVCGTHPGQCG